MFEPSNFEGGIDRLLLIEALQKVPPSWKLYRNMVGNIALRDENDKYVGYIDVYSRLIEEMLEIFEEV